jgi:hypothetical protein
MSNIPDIKEAVMPFEEKFTWVSAVVSTGVAAVYFAIVLGQVRTVPVAEIAYQWPLLIAIGSLIVLTIVGAIVVAIGTAISAEITGSGSVDDIGRNDERDADINRRGELVGYYVSSAGALGVLALAMLRYDPFWIANALYLSFVVGALVSSAAKLVAYRRGF